LYVLIRFTIIFNKKNHFFFELFAFYHLDSTVRPRRIITSDTKLKNDLHELFFGNRPGSANAASANIRR